MIEVLREMRKLHCDNLKKMQRCKSAQIFSDAHRARIRDIVDGYFRTDRPMLVKRFRDEELFGQMDGLMQSLLALTQRNSVRTKYLNLFKATISEIDVIERKLLPKTADLAGLELNGEDAEFLDTLRRLSPYAASCYQQALIDIRDRSRHSWRGTATELRESVREVLDVLASDEEVAATSGFKLEPNAKGPTMRQKARYILRRSRTSNCDTSVSLVDTIDERFGGFVRNVYSQSSASVHSNGNIDDIRSLKKYVDLALADLISDHGA